MAITGQFSNCSTSISDAKTATLVSTVPGGGGGGGGSRPRLGVGGPAGACNPDPV